MKSMQRANINSQHGEGIRTTNNSTRAANAVKSMHAESGPTRPKPPASVVKKSAAKVNNKDEFTQEESELLKRLDGKMSNTQDKTLAAQQEPDASNVVMT
jgi:hypothetical protein